MGICIAEIVRLIRNVGPGPAALNSRKERLVDSRFEQEATRRPSQQRYIAPHQ